MAHNKWNLRCVGLFHVLAFVCLLTTALPLRPVDENGSETIYENNQKILTRTKRQSNNPIASLLQRLQANQREVERMAKENVKKIPTKPSKLLTTHPAFTSPIKYTTLLNTAKTYTPAFIAKMITEAMKNEVNYHEDNTVTESTIFHVETTTALPVKTTMTDKTEVNYHSNNGIIKLLEGIVATDSQTASKSMPAATKIKTITANPVYEQTIITEELKLTNDINNDIITSFEGSATTKKQAETTDTKTTKTKSTNIPTTTVKLTKTDDDLNKEIIKSLERIEATDSQTASTSVPATIEIETITAKPVYEQTKITEETNFNNDINDEIITSLEGSATTKKEDAFTVTKTKSTNMPTTSVKTTITDKTEINDDLNNETDSRTASTSMPATSEIETTTAKPVYDQKIITEETKIHNDINNEILTSFEISVTTKKQPATTVTKTKSSNIPITSATIPITTKIETTTATPFKEMIATAAIADITELNKDVNNDILTSFKTSEAAKKQTTIVDDNTIVSPIFEKTKTTAIITTTGTKTTIADMRNRTTLPVFTTTSEETELNNEVTTSFGRIATTTTPIHTGIDAETVEIDPQTMTTLNYDETKQVVTIMNPFTGDIKTVAINGETGITLFATPESTETEATQPTTMPTTRQNVTTTATIDLKDCPKIDYETKCTILEEDELKILKDGQSFMATKIKLVALGLIGLGNLLLEDEPTAVSSIFSELKSSRNNTENVFSYNNTCLCNL